jgi:terpene synthase-like protein
VPNIVDFPIPYPSKFNPEADAVRHGVQAWLADSGIFDAGHRVPALENVDSWQVASCAARVWPEASGDDLLLAAKFLIWYLLHDDAFDGPVGRDPVAARALCQDFVAVVEGTSRADASGLLRAFQELWGSATEGMSQEWVRRSRANWVDFLTSYADEAASRSNRALPTSLEQYLALRRRSVGMETCFDLTERFYHCELAPRLARDNRLITMRRLAGEVVALVNDVFSVEKEEALGDHLNAVLVIERIGGRTREQAVAQARDEVGALTVELARLEAELLVEHGIAPVSEALALRRFTTNLWDWSRGSVDWHIETSRYRVRGREPGAVCTR